MKNLIYFDGEAVTARGRPANEFYLINKGLVSIMSHNGKYIKKIYRVGEIFGLAEVLSNSDWPYTSIASGETFLSVYEGNILHIGLGNLEPAYKNLIDDLSHLALAS